MIENCYVTYVRKTSSPVASGKCDKLPENFNFVTFAGWVKELLLRRDHDMNWHDLVLPDMTS